MTGIMEDKTSIWNDIYPIHSYEVGPDKLTPLPILCWYLQESAYRNADHLGFQGIF